MYQSMFPWNSKFDTSEIGTFKFKLQITGNVIFALFVVRLVPWLQINISLFSNFLSAFVFGKNLLM